MRLTTIAVLTLTILHCSDGRRIPPRDAVKEHMSAARMVTKDCAASRLASWNVHASAAGRDCGILLIETPMILEDSIIEAMHYGTGAYDLYRGGVNQFSRDRTFRGVAYKDGSGQLWFYGNLSRAEAESLRPCR
ncbi:MAG TPA: hypothetical protein VGR95_12000 [Thermoanaerobaculia bacterium]|jgi:hypothetical protein|nr:hypothetical protein [Thermoanaerobaculia bacterium]